MLKSYLVIDEGLPGGGNFLIFNNDCYNSDEKRSQVLEINGFINDLDEDTGDYVNPPDAGYVQVGGGFFQAAETNSRQIVWNYRSNSNNSFYSNFISGMQRLPNGNTFIYSGAHGHFFEVTSDGDVVWEYINPVRTVGFGPGAKVIFAEVASDSAAPGAVFRALRYGPDYPGLQGRDLTPLGTLTGRVPLSATVGGVAEYQTAPVYTGWGFSGTGIGGGGAAGAAGGY